MLELTGFGLILAAIGYGYVALAFGLAGLALWYVPRWPYKVICAIAVLAVFLSSPVQTIMDANEKQRLSQVHLAKAMARFEELCKTSGEFINKTAIDVNGLLLIKLRPAVNRINSIDAIDPYGADFDGQGEPYGNGAYISSFLRARDGRGKVIEDVSGAISGYEYVDIVDPESGVRYRYRGEMGVPPHLKGNPVYKDRSVFVLSEPKIPELNDYPEYGVTYDDITLAEDRAMWIAGSSLRVVELGSGEVMGERVGYMIDPGQGSTAGARSPWLSAGREGFSCPARSSILQTRTFVEKIIKVKGSIE